MGGTLTINGSEVRKLNYLSNPVTKLQLNGVDIWNSYYTVTYNANGHGTNPNNQYKEDGKGLILRSFLPDETISSNGTTVSFDPNGGSSTPSSITSTLSSTYNQYEWNTDAGGGGTSYASGATYTTDADLSLNAMWNTTRNYSSVTMPAAIEKSGGVFVNWNSKQDGTGTAFLPNTLYDPGTYTDLLNDPTLYAKFGSPVTTTLVNQRGSSCYQYTWTYVENSYWNATIFKYDDELYFPNYQYTVCCDGSWISLASAVAGGYIDTFTYYRYNHYSPVSQGVNVIMNSTFHNGGYKNFRWYDDSDCSGVQVNIVTKLNKNVTGVRLYPTSSETCGYTVSRTTYQ